jgi:hypothetical protein
MIAEFEHIDLNNRELTVTISDTVKYPNGKNGILICVNIDEPVKDLAMDITPDEARQFAQTLLEIANNVEQQQK